MTDQQARPRGMSRLVAVVTSLPGRIAIGCIVVAWTVPLAGLLVTSLRPSSPSGESGWWSVLTDPSMTLDHYRTALSGDGGGIATAVVNTLIVAIPATVIPVVLAALAAYAFSWTSFRGRDGLFLGVAVLAVLPVQLALVPLFSAYMDLGLVGTWVGLWFAHTAFALPIAILLLRTAMGALPRDLIDAARTDGASHLSTFMRVVLPLSLPAVAAVATLQFLWVWNDYLAAVTFLGGYNPDVSPASVALAELVRSQGHDHHLVSAATVVTFSVPLVVFVTLQHSVLQGWRAAASHR